MTQTNTNKEENIEDDEIELWSEREVNQIGKLSLGTYSIGYNKALEDVEKMLHELELIKSLGVSEIAIGFYNDDWDRFKQQLKELKNGQETKSGVNINRNLGADSSPDTKLKEKEPTNTNKEEWKLSDKREPDYGSDFYYWEQDVQEKIQKAKERLKESLSNDCTDCNDWNKREVDKIFLEEFGDKLI